MNDNYNLQLYLDTGCSYVKAQVRWALKYTQNFNELIQETKFKLIILFFYNFFNNGADLQLGFFAAQAFFLIFMIGLWKIATKSL